MTKHSGGMDSGCLASLVGIVFFAGNVFLFSGALTDDLEGNAFAILFSIAAIVADIAIIYWVIKSISATVEKKQLQRRQAIATATRNEIDTILSRYSFPDTGFISNELFTNQLKLNKPHHAFMMCVDRFRTDTKSLYDALTELHEKNVAILSCPNCFSDEQRLSFLHEELPTLEAQKELISSLLDEYYTHRIVLPSVGDSTLTSLKNALIKMKNSKKCKSEGPLTFTVFGKPSELPAELSCFKYRTPPIVFTCESYSFCMFADLILIFMDGVFLFASYPDELTITTTPIEESIYVFNGAYSSDIVDDDSKCKQVGTTSKTWQYIRRDGLPDLRYSYNPVIDYHVDRIVYGNVKLEISGYSVEYNFSSYAALEAIEEASKQYFKHARSLTIVHEVESSRQTNLHEIEPHQPNVEISDPVLQERACTSFDQTEVNCFGDIIDTPAKNSPAYTLTTNKHQNGRTNSFIVYSMDQNEESSELRFKPQIINYPFLQDENVHKKEPYITFDNMRRVEALRDQEYSTPSFAISSSGYGVADRFFAQAKFMEAFVDNYEDHADFQCYYPTYSNMSNEQLRTYFTWRTKVRNGQIERTDLSYAFVYIYEMLNRIGEVSANEGLVRLLDFWHKYRYFDKKIDHYLERWVKDYYVYYQLECPFEDILVQFPEGIPKESNIQQEIFHHNYENKSAFLNQLSSHKFLSSKFYESELGYTLLECIPPALNAIDAFFQAREVSFPSLLIGSAKREDYWRPFSRAVVVVHNPSVDYSVKISSLEEYVFINGKWQSQRLQPNFFSNLLGYIIKTVEAELRDLTGYKRKLKPNINSIIYDNIQDKHIQKMIYDPVFTETIRNTTRAYFAQSGIRPDTFKIAAQDDDVSVKPVEVHVDFAKLDAIRAAAAEIQERLVIDESACEDDYLSAAPISTTPQIPHTQTEQKSETDDTPPRILLSEQQRLCLRVIMNGNTVNSRVSEIAKANGMLPEMLLENINDTLFETFGDNIIDTAGDEPSIYDDYIDELINMIEEA